jgi:Flp pilus assembly protein TadG
MRKRNRGLTTVEFSIVASLLFTLLFAVFEFGRLLYTYAALGEGTRRAARLAAVCPLNDAGIASTANFASLPNFTSSNIQVSYLDSSGGTTAAFSAIRYVRVQIVGYSIRLSIPLINPTITSPAFAVTLPRESLGVTRTATYTCS